MLPVRLQQASNWNSKFWQSRAHATADGNYRVFNVNLLQLSLLILSLFVAPSSLSVTLSQYPLHTFHLPIDQFNNKIKYALY